MFCPEKPCSLIQILGGENKNRYCTFLPLKPDVLDHARQLKFGTDCQPCLEPALFLLREASNFCWNL